MSVLMEQHQARRARLGFGAVPVRVNLEAIGRRRPVPRVDAPPPPVAAPEPRVRPGAPFNFLKRPSPEAIIHLVALRYRISYFDIVGRSREKGIVEARRLSVRLIESHCRQMSSMRLGRLFHRDHSSILNLLGRRGQGGIYQNSSWEALKGLETIGLGGKRADLLAPQKHGVLMEDHLMNGKVV